MSQFLSLLHKYVPAGLKEMWTEQISQVLRAGIAIALYCQMDEGVYGIWLGVFG